jgi:hypothetical protein
MTDEAAEPNNVSPVLKADWFNSRWGRRTSWETVI